MLEKFARDKGFENTLFLADDGYSGTNFERPSWKKIVEMIEAGQVANLIVKDASRLGREYLQVGYYMEIYFPQKNVRFIAVNDGWIPQWRAAMTSTPSATGQTNSTQRTRVGRFAP
ncbi:MAG: recombinase family protein [Oscillospiraceae bacterium]